MSIFEEKIKELQQQLERLRERQRTGWRYRKTWIKPTTVKKHRRSGYYAMLPIKKVKP